MAKTHLNYHETSIIANLYRSGVKVDAIAKAFDITITRVIDILDINKLKRHHRSECEDRNKEIRELRKQGLSFTQIGKRYNLSRQRVSEITRDL